MTAYNISDSNAVISCQILFFSSWSVPGLFMLTFSLR